MSHDRDRFDETEWSLEERARLEALSGTREPSPDVKRRTIAELHARGLLGRRRSISPALAGGLAAAATIVFMAGVFAGYTIAERRVDVRPAQVPPTIREVARAASAAARPTRQVVWF